MSEAAGRTTSADTVKKQGEDSGLISPSPFSVSQPANVSTNMAGIVSAQAVLDPVKLTIRT